MASPIFDLCDEYVTRSAELDPVMATYRGVAGYDAAGTDYGPDGAAGRADLMRDTLRRLDALDPGDDADRRASAHLRERLRAELDWHDTGEWMRNLRAGFGVLQMVRESVDLVRRDDEDGWRAVAGRLAGVPATLASWRRSLDQGRSRGAVAARRQAVEAAARAGAYADGTHESLVGSYGDGPLRGELDAAATAAHAAYGDLARYLRDEYAPDGAEHDGVGEQRYRVFTRLYLGADLDPRESYAWGWAELRRLEAEMAAEVRALGSAAGAPGSTADSVGSAAGLAEAVAMLDETECVTGEDAYRAWLQREHDLALERLDGVHFEIAPALRRVEVVLAPPSSGGGVYYTGPSEDLSRPGRTWWSVAGRQRFAVWRELTTVFHEGVPGHHLQVGRARLGGAGMSRFSRLGGAVSGHGEGWALYAERLADELGWHDGRPGTRLGMLQASAMRAARVVVDIGLHLGLALPADEAAHHPAGWTFDAAAQVLRERGHCPEHLVHSEMVRYAGWPAQATAYKLGERVWLAARDEARARLGAGFDLKRWHTAALALGPVGLSTLSDELRRAA
jgi:uncharacterized protein (DUF885 family)